MKLHTAMVLGLLLCLVACARDPKTSYVVAFLGPSVDGAAVVAAVDEWNACGVVRIELRADVDPDFTIEAVDARETSNDFADPRVAGNTQRGGVVLYRTGYPKVQGTIAHELGHAMGLGHEDGTVMQAIGGPEHVTPGDCSALRDR